MVIYYFYIDLEFFQTWEGDPQSADSLSSGFVQIYTLNNIAVLIGLQLLFELNNKLVRKMTLHFECLKTTDDNAHILIKKMAEQIGIRSEKIYRLCKFNQYNVYFNGKAGVGKSTSISTLFGLINKDELNQGKNIGNLLLLKTGSGRTTVCETRIIPNAPQSKICIEAEEEAKFNMILGEFCKMFESKPSSLSDEEARVTKNMAGLPLDSHCIEDISNLQITESDEKEFNNL